MKHSFFIYLLIFFTNLCAQDNPYGSHNPLYISPFPYPSIEDNLDKWIYDHGNDQNYLRQICFNPLSKYSCSRVVGSLDALDILFKHNNLEWYLDNLPNIGVYFEYQNVQPFTRNFYINGLLFQETFPFDPSVWSDYYNEDKYKQSKLNEVSELINSQNIVDSLRKIIHLNSILNKNWQVYISEIDSVRIEYIKSFENQNIPSDQMKIINSRKIGGWSSLDFDLNNQDTSNMKFATDWIHKCKKIYNETIAQTVESISNDILRLEDQYLNQYFKKYSHYYCLSLIRNGVILTYNRKESESFKDGKIELITIIEMNED